MDSGCYRYRTNLKLTKSLFCYFHDNISNALLISILNYFFLTNLCCFVFRIMNKSTHWFLYILLTNGLLTFSIYFHYSIFTSQYRAKRLTEVLVKSAVNDRVEYRIRVCDECGEVWNTWKPLWKLSSDENIIRNLILVSDTTRKLYH